MDIRASFPLESKYGVSDLSAAAEKVTYTAEVKGDIDPVRLRAAFDWAESVCHVVRSLEGGRWRWPRSCASNGVTVAEA